MPTANQYMSSDPVTARGGEGLLDAARRMRELHVGCLIVVEGAASDRRPIGILTDRDIVVGVLAQTDQKLHLLRVDDVMTRKLVVAREDEDLDEVLRRMRAKGVRRVPVVDSYGLVKGILAADDILEHVREQVDAIVALIGRERIREEQVRGRRSDTGAGHHGVKHAHHGSRPVDRRPPRAHARCPSLADGAWGARTG